MKSVLIVDDNPLVLGLLRSALVSSGWIRCEESKNGRDAILQAQRLRPDVIVLDLSMPEMNGLETARILRRLIPTTPLIMFTSHFVPGLEREALAAGFRCVVPKSDGAPGVINAIENVLIA